MSRLALGLAFAFFGGGCTHLQLKRSAVGQARTLDHIYQQQVLDNLAKFVHDANALPHFALPNTGNSTVSDTGTMSPGITWSDVGFSGASLGLQGNRNVTLAWAMDPIRDPHKLALMRCAYQKAVASCGAANVPPNCAECDTAITKFYDGHGHSNPIAGVMECGGCWFRWGTKKDLPKKCDCIPVGHYCGVYVWVLPEGRDQLARLTLAILDFALYEPPTEIVRTKTVVVHLNAENAPTTPAQAVKSITAEVDISEDLTEAAKRLLSGEGAKPLTPLKLPRMRSFGPEPSLFQLQNQLRTITPRPAPR
jgi:hypothetical protein